MSIPPDWPALREALRAVFSARVGAQAEWCAALGIPPTSAGKYVGRSATQEPSATRALQSLRWLASQSPRR